MANITEYKIAGIYIQIETPQPITLTKNFVPFLITNDSDKPDEKYFVEVQEVQHLPQVYGKPILHNQDYDVFDINGENVLRCYHDHEKNDQPYAVTTFYPDKRKIQIDYLQEGRRFFSEAGNCFFHVGWESILIHEERMILHASCINTQWGGILFSGPSGVGKSTQSDLWYRYEDASLINGDRPILGREEKIWYAYGSPYAGSSKCYVNDCCKIRAIVILKKAERCSIRELRSSEAFKKIFSELTVNSWDAFFVNQACDLTISLINELPIYELECVPDQRAVNILKRKLEEEGEE